MEGNMRLKCLILLSGALIAQPVWAQEQDGSDGLGTVSFDFPIRDEYITVLASGADERLDWTGESVTVFGREEMDAVQGPDLARLLERAPGVTLSRNGGPGNFTAV